MSLTSAPGTTGGLSDDTAYDVVVVGGGPVGFATAIELGSRRLSVLLVEHEDGVVRCPTAESVDTASMELLRRWGISDEVLRSGFPSDERGDISFVSRMTTYEPARFPRPGNADRRGTTQGLSPEGGVWWPKFGFELALRERAAAEPAVDLRHRWTCEAFDDDTRGVTVRLASQAYGRRTVRARYVVACDGATSPVHLDRPAPEVEVLDAREWSGDAVVADSFRSGHVLLAGDSAHSVWPSGGHGMNTGLGDVANLGWKLEGVLRGWAPDALLDTYTAERRPHAERMVRRAWHNYRADNAILPDQALDDPAQKEARDLAAERIVATRQTEWRSLGAQLGVCYPKSPLIVSDGTAEPPADPEEYVPTARPGHRAPHVELADGTSVLDLFRGRFTLLNIAPAVDSGDLAQAFRTRGIPLDEEWVGADGVREVYGCAITLVRPDGIVAWRGDVGPADPDAVVDQVIGRSSGAY